MSGMYLDAVLNSDMEPVFNGTPEDTVIWLKSHPRSQYYDVCVGKTLQFVKATEYLEMAPKLPEPTDKKKFDVVHQMVKLAMIKQETATREGDTRCMELTAEHIAKKIALLFE